MRIRIDAYNHKSHSGDCGLLPGVQICAGQQCSLTYRLAYHKSSNLNIIGVFNAARESKQKAQSTIPEYKELHVGVGGAQPICVYTQIDIFVCSHKLHVCVTAQNHK